MRPGKTLRASYAVNELIAKVSESHTISEHLVNQAIVVCVKIGLGEEATYAVQKILFSNDTVRRRLDEMAENLEDSRGEN